MLRLVDANLNRCREGLRVLEDVARFILDDASLSQRFRRIRHGLIEADASFLSHRNAVSDVGAAEPPARPRGDLAGLVTANCRRVEESLRVLEEFAQLPGVMDSPDSTDSSGFKSARFDLYTLEKELTHRVLRRDRLEKLTGLYVIVDTAFLRGRSEVDVARQAIGGGARVIQLRDKKRDHGALLPAARDLRQLCSREGVLFVVNDYLDVALASDADGLHLGQDDLPLPVARRLLPGDRILGVSTHSVEQAVRAQAEGADYIGVGAIYPTASKDVITLVGPEMIRRVKERVSIPIVAIGGIKKDNVSQVMAAGPTSVAVITAVVAADDVAGAARELVNRMKSHPEQANGKAD
ncbi:MAG: thiamine phosphate synthase [Chloroflexi bacterium]|nr:thiamine phosphate synthase [Chloroflexota bacterium]